MKDKQVWSHVDHFMKEVEHYYGMKFDNSFEARIKNEIINNLLVCSLQQVPRTVCARCVNNKIYKGRMQDDILIELLALRDKLDKSTMQKDDWETLLAKYEEPKYVYCFDDNTLHGNINSLIGLYLMKHKCSNRVFSVVKGELHLKFNKVLLADAFDMYIKKETSITEKLKVLDDEKLKDIRKDKLAAWDYVNKVLLDGAEAMEDTLTTSFDSELADIAKEKDIVSCDLRIRCRSGMELEEAVELGVKDSEKYGFKNEALRHSLDFCVLEGTTYNICKYIQYLATQENLAENIGGIQ